ncbi:MAG: VWA domain-containing protein, partial [Pseudonocardiales bacterium]|nr:VWA domain-containing protein [Pseudonocardiales bacterium]
SEVLRHRDLAELSPAEREHLRVLLALLRVGMPKRTSRRRRPARRGPVDPGRTLRAALRNHGELRELRHHGPTTRARKVVLLIDVSGSMAPYADTLLRFAHVLVRQSLVRQSLIRHSPVNTEVFTIGTRLTRITRELRHRDPELALTAAGRAIPDWSGGTRLGEVLRAFNDRWGQRGVARRAVVVVFSDGWERGEPDELAVQMGRLRRLAHRMIWVNPHAGKDGYAPVQGGIVAVLPHLDQLLAGHSLATLERLLEEMAR